MNDGKGAKESLPSRRRVLALAAVLAAGVVYGKTRFGLATSARTMAKTDSSAQGIRELVTLFLCGDVMSGRGIDQILGNPVNPVLYEPYVTSAIHYLESAEAVNGPIPRSADPAYVWGDALEVLDSREPDVRIVNLETSITRSEDYAPKGINYRMAPENASCLAAAGIDCCVLANNHVLDWGMDGLVDTLQTLQRLNIGTAGAGHNEQEAEAPAIIPVAAQRRAIVFGLGVTTSGIPKTWAARPGQPGVNVLKDLSNRVVDRIAEQVGAVKKAGDIVVASIHWGPNWGYRIAEEERRFAHRLIEAAGIDIVHGHSSHHPKAIEVYQGKLILYGCGDFLNDYEGIKGYEEFRDDLALMYLPTVAGSNGRLVKLEMIPFQIRNFTLRRASSEDTALLRDVLARECERFGASVRLTNVDTLELAWQ